MRFIPYFDYAAAALIIVLVLHFIVTRTIRNQKNVVFGLLIHIIMVTVFSDIVTVWIGNNNVTVPLALNYIINAVYLLSSGAVAALYFTYVYLIAKDGEAVSRQSQVLVSLPLDVSLILMLINPLNGWIYYFDASGAYQRGPLHSFLYVIAGLYILGSLGIALKIFAKLTMWQRIAMFIYPTAIILVMLIQLKMPDVLLVPFAETVACQILLFSVENPADYKEKNLDVYSAEGFYEQFKFAVIRGREFQVLAIHVDGLEALTELMGMDVTTEILKEITDYLNRDCKKKVFRLKARTFVIMDDKKEEEWEKVINTIHTRFRKPFQANDTQVTLSSSMVMLHYPEDVTKLDDVLDMIRYGTARAAELGSETVLKADAGLLEKGHRESYVIHAIKKAIQDKSFKVYYQPIYDSEAKRVTRAEALIRLIDDELGFIPPDEFITLAEQNGLIIEVGAQVFEKACQFMSREKTWERGIERIDINLSAVQCMEENLADHLIDIMDVYNVPYKAVNLEVTETAAVQSEDSLRINMEKLMEKGVNFSVDDYGTGYSNMTNIIDYPFTVVKIDKSMLWTAVKNNQAMIALKHTISMLNDMGLEIITEGIEDENMAEILNNLGCSLHQGFFYSKPLPEEQFMFYLNNDNQG